MYEFKYLVDTFLDDILAIGSILLCGLIVCGLIGIKYYLDNRTQQKRLWLKKYGEHTDGTVISMYEKQSTVRVRIFRTQYNAQGIGTMMMGSSIPGNLYKIKRIFIISEI